MVTVFRPPIVLMPLVIGVQSAGGERVVALSSTVTGMAGQDNCRLPGRKVACKRGRRLSVNVAFCPAPGLTPALNQWLSESKLTALTVPTEAETNGMDGA